MSKQNVRTHSHSGATKKLLSSCLVFSVHFLVMFRQVNSSYTSFHTQWADETLWNNNFSLSSVKQNTSIQTANMYKKRLNNCSWVWIRGSSWCSCKRRKVSLKRNLKVRAHLHIADFPWSFAQCGTQLVWLKYSGLHILNCFCWSTLSIVTWTPILAS